jgi:hypothetical protein
MDNTSRFVKNHGAHRDSDSGRPTLGGSETSGWTNQFITLTHYVTAPKKSFSWEPFDV